MPVRLTALVSRSAHSSFNEWVGGDKERFLTNGIVSFPEQRPKGTEWRDLPVPAMQECYWAPFLAAIEGCFLRELLTWDKLSAKVRKEQDALPKETKRQSALTRVIRHGLWQGSPDCECVSIGTAIVFEVPRPELGTAWVVDVPKVGAIYFFGTKEEALEFANGAVQRSRIRPHQRHVDHFTGWEDAVTEVLKSVPAQSFYTATA